MPDYEVTITLTNVAYGDAQDVAEAVWDQFSEPLDAATGEFKVAIFRLSNGQRFREQDWMPDSE